MFIKLALSLLVLVSINASSEELSDDSMRLSYCEGVYLYAGRVAMLMNNEGMAKDLFLRASRVTSANLLLNVKDGVVSGETLKKIRVAQGAIKPVFDPNPKSIFPEVSDCDRKTKEPIRKVIALGKKLDGHDYYQLQSGMFETYLKSSGIR